MDFQSNHCVAYVFVSVFKTDNVAKNPLINRNESTAKNADKTNNEE